VPLMQSLKFVSDKQLSSLIVGEYRRSMSLSSILVLHGPNLNLLGHREPDVYGTSTVADHVQTVKNTLGARDVAVTDIQSNSESELVNAVHAAKGVHDAIVINAGAFTHYSWALHDALRSFDGRIIEVHISNPGAREEFRHVSVLASVVDGSISGFGGLGYKLAVEALLSMSAG
jgi:3-dehydroquinate dehydratase II